MASNYRKKACVNRIILVDDDSIKIGVPHLGRIFFLRQIINGRYGDISIVHEPICRLIRDDLSGKKMEYNFAFFPHICAIMKYFPSVPEILLINHLFTDNYLLSKKKQKMLSELDDRFIPEDHDAIMKSFKRMIKCVNIDYETLSIFSTTVNYDFVLNDLKFMNRDINGIIASFL